MSEEENISTEEVLASIRNILLEKQTIEAREEILSSREICFKSLC